MNPSDATLADPTLALFITKAEAVSATVTPVATPQEALQYAVDLCERKEACQLLASGCEAALSPDAEALCETKPTKVMAAPGLTPEARDTLSAMCVDRGILLADQDLRQHLGGIDVGLTFADFGIADTGTLVIDSSSEQLRLATMISEIHVAVLPRARLRPSAYDLEEELRAGMRRAPNYTAFITGASRTADIERVLALGVHGPLELHILIMEDS